MKLLLSERRMREEDVTGMDRLRQREEKGVNDSYEGYAKLKKDIQDPADISEAADRLKTAGQGLFFYQPKIH